MVLAPNAWIPFLHPKLSYKASIFIKANAHCFNIKLRQKYFDSVVKSYATVYKHESIHRVKTKSYPE